MPEGPSIVILKEAVAAFKGRKIIEVSGNTSIDKERLLNKKIVDFKSWGKHFLICFKGFTVRIHFLLFGSYLINETKDRPIRLGLVFNNGTINFYACAIKFIEEDLNEVYDFTADVMNDSWDPKNALVKLNQNKNALVCDALLEQDIFSGVGNIIKNEVLYRICVHPLSSVKKLPPAKINQLIKEAREYSFEFLEWKKQGVLKKHWLAHRKKICQRCDLPLISEHTGTKRRRSYFCINCQKLYK